MVCPDLTRSTDCNNVLFYESAEAENELNETTLHKYWLNKINTYKLQDQKANREINDSKCVDPSWFRKKLEITHDDITGQQRVLINNPDDNGWIRLSNNNLYH